MCCQHVLIACLRCIKQTSTYVRLDWNSTISSAASKEHGPDGDRCRATVADRASRFISLRLFAGLLFGGRGCLVTLLAVLSFPGQTESLSTEPVVGSSIEAQLEPLTELALNYGQYPIPDRRQAIDQAYMLLNSSTKPLPRLQAKVDLAFSYLHYELGNTELAINTLNSSLERIDIEEDPEAYVRATGLLAGLLTTTGQRDASQREAGLKMLEQLLATEVSESLATRIEYARVNYASTLRDMGRVQEASQAYEQVLQYARAANDDVLALAAGVNYFSLLKDQKIFAEAQYWLTQLKPAMNRLPNAWGSAALELHEFGLMLKSGEVDTVISGIQAFMQRPHKQPEMILGQSQLIYSEALRAAGRLDESLSAGRKAIGLMDGFPFEQIDAHIAVVHTLLAMEDYAAAGEQLNLLESFDLSRPSLVTIVHHLRLEHALRTGDIERAELAFDDYTASSKKLNAIVNSRQADHYGAKLRSQRATLELKLAREAQVAAQNQRNLQIGGIVFLAFAAIGMVALSARHRLQKRLQEELSERNASLSALVDAKSKDLVDTVTEQASLKQALAERRHMEAIGQIAGHVAHDFNNTLQVVSSANDLLESLAETDSDYKVINASNLSIQSGSSTVRQLLAYSRNQQLESRVFLVADYLKDNASLFRSAIGEVNRLRIENQVTNARVNLDEGQLTASLINLLRNASDAMDSPGEIILRAATGEAVEEGSTSLQVLPRVELQVIDQGRGMSEEQASRALEPYYSTKTAETGTGLGLSSVYGFVVQSGGGITLDSKRGEGTTVTLSFPRHAGAVPKTSPSRNLAPILSRVRVLLVEDNDLIAQTLLAMLHREGAQPTWVDSADRAQAMLTDSPMFDLMLSDINIPGAMNGFNLARWVQAHYPEMQIGMMSGYGPTMSEDFDIPVLAKPFTRQQLLTYLADRVDAVNL